MKHYTATITVEIYAGTEENAIQSAKQIKDNINKNAFHTAELESVTQYRSFIHNRTLDIHKEERMTFSDIKNYFFKIFA